MKSFGLGATMEDIATTWLFSDGTVPLQRFRRYAVAFDLNLMAFAGEQSEAITTHQIVTSVFIFPLAKTIEIHALTSNFKNFTKHP